MSPGSRATRAPPSARPRLFNSRALANARAAQRASECAASAWRPFWIAAGRHARAAVRALLSKKAHSERRPKKHSLLGSYFACADVVRAQKAQRLHSVRECACARQSFKGTALVCARTLALTPASFAEALPAYGERASAGTSAQPQEAQAKKTQHTRTLAANAPLPAVHSPQMPCTIPTEQPT